MKKHPPFLSRGAEKRNPNVKREGLTIWYFIITDRDGNRLNWRFVLVTIILVAIIVVETVFIVSTIRMGPGAQTTARGTLVLGSKENLSANYSLFDAAIANDTQFNFTRSYDGSWLLSIYDDLQFSTSMTNETSTEAQVAIAPIGPTEALSIPTLIVQERADGLLRVEYYAQNWPNTYGLVLYNSTRTDLFGPSSNISLEFISYGPPSAVNPSIAPKSNGNLTILSGNTVLVSNYPIAWASLDSAYFYGLRGTSFTQGQLTVSVRPIQVEG